MPLAASTTQTTTRKGAPLWLILTLATVAFLLAIAAFVAVMISVTQSSLRRSTPYKTALALANESPCAVARLGQPVAPGRFIVGSISKTNGEAYADMEFPVHGPRGEGRLHVVGVETAGHWTMQYLSLRTDDTRTMLLPAAPCP